MTTKADFNAMEWQAVTEGPALAGLIVIAAQRGGTIRETFAVAKVYAEAKAEHDGHDLLGEIAATAPRLEPREFDSAETLRTQGIERIRNAVALLVGKASADEVEAYKRFSLTVARRAAEADKSGGVLGIGGERVSDAEAEALQAVADALGTDLQAGSAPAA